MPHYLLFFLIGSFLASPLIAQDSLDIHSKYWHYRKRLIGDEQKAGFVMLGIGPGHSIPAIGRNPDADCIWDWHLNHNKCFKTLGKGKIRWSDASIFLGIYMTVLAHEYANQEKQGADFYQLKLLEQEIWWALLAFDRLDRHAEEALGLSPQLNGFFLRDDIPAFLADSSKNYNNRYFGTSNFKYHCIESDYSCNEISVHTGDFMSQDQILGLFLGFRSIQKFLGEKKLRTDLPSFGEKVATQVSRIMDYLIEVRWRLKTPDGQKIPEKWGGHAIGMSYPIAKAANIMVNAYPSSDKAQKVNYLKKGAASSGKILFQLLGTSFYVQREVNQVLAFSGAVAANRWSGRKIARRALKTDKVIFALLHSSLNDVPIHKSIPWGDVEKLLNAAPDNGPCFLTEGCEAPPGWQSYDRWFFGRHKNGNPHGIAGEFSGLDYMLLYNLYVLLYKNDNKQKK